MPEKLVWLRRVVAIEGILGPPVGLASVDSRYVTESPAPVIMRSAVVAVRMNIADTLYPFPLWNWISVARVMRGPYHRLSIRISIARLVDGGTHLSVKSDGLWIIYPIEIASDGVSSIEQVFVV